MQYENTYKNVKLVGTSHIAQQSIQRINQIFDGYQPDIICVELDRKRYHALITNQKPDYSFAGIRKYGLQGYLFAVIGGIIQQKLGNVVGMKPGADMLAAIDIAKKNSKQLALIDQDIELTLKRFSKSFTWREKFRLAAEIFKTPFAKKAKIDLSKIPEQELVSKLMLQLKDSYPNIYKTLITERNAVMAKNIYGVMIKNSEKRIMVVVGAGHEKELLKEVKREDFKRDRIY